MQSIEILICFRLPMYYVNRSPKMGVNLFFQWYAGNFACKFLMFMKAFAFYLSSMTLVTLSLDRCLAIAKPMASLKRTEKGSRLAV